MKLRRWQKECIDAVFTKYKDSNRFLCLATPGAGKTFLASQVARQLLEGDRVDFVVCFSPSVIISKEFGGKLAEITGKRFDGLIGASGMSLTYQSMQYLSEEFWELLKQYRVFVIFDEIHHCAGKTTEDANSWGREILKRVKNNATYTLALTGTPWRSDNTPIVLAEYCDDSERIQCDYTYGVVDAIKDKVCRLPQIVVTDNDNIQLQRECGDVQHFEGFEQLLEKSKCPYQKIVESESVILHMLQEANDTLRHVRKQNPNAAGLVVASSVKHAKQIHSLLVERFQQEAEMVTYQEEKPADIITNFKEGTIPWIVSVGMISEGTNIPRLQVCCHLTRIKTELHFRQILGRILRDNGALNRFAYMFMPAEKTLIDYAYRIAEDIPDEMAIVHFSKSSLSAHLNESVDSSDDKPGNDDSSGYSIKILTNEEEQADTSEEEVLTDTPYEVLKQTYEATLNIFGRFKQDVLNLSVSPFEESV